ncbi:DinB family protein [Allorhodopirellula solitaria]|uniref:DinB superfamily protein n=1 Tax=Allorhodopirellula solitaria TaxID=2527987 RepID=A0A5C5YJZ8_9BACT|nr:DinB family protein [Allorhodopirellula solitaria]TWT75149.1 DinB superfamily protein [Allorhodopirellula solitaria]
MNRKSRRPSEQDLPLPIHRSYVDKVDGDCVLKVLADQLYWICDLGSCLSAELVDREHAPYTWTVRQVMEHCVDAERIWGDRMLRIAAGDTTNLPAWDENAYAAARFGLGNLTHLISELGNLRQANLLLLGRIVPAAWDQVGRVDSQPLTPRGIAWLAAGHLQHHFEIIEARCEISPQRLPM